MDKVTNITVEPLVHSKFMRPLRMHYSQNGVKKIWDMGISHPSVTVIIFNKTSKKLLLVKQLRPAVLLADIKEKNPDSVSDDYEKTNNCLKGLDKNVDQWALLWSSVLELLIKKATHYVKLPRKKS